MSRLMPSLHPRLVMQSLAAAGLAFGAVPAAAQVIEVGDDGHVQTYSKPTRFVSSADGAVDRVAPEVTRTANQVDRFEQAARTADIDVDLLRAVAWNESHFHADAISPKGALGLMQLMPATAAALGIDPRDPDANVHGGARYLALQLQKFGSVPLALAAYNAGPGAVLRWGGIPPYAETRAYVSAIMSRWTKGGWTPSAGAPRPALVAAPRVAVAQPLHPLLLEVPAP